MGRCDRSALKICIEGLKDMVSGVNRRLGVLAYGNGSSILLDVKWKLKLLELKISGPPNQALDWPLDADVSGVEVWGFLLGAAELWALKSGPGPISLRHLSLITCWFSHRTTRDSQCMEIGGVDASYLRPSKHRRLSSVFVSVPRQIDTSVISTDLR